MDGLTLSLVTMAKSPYWPYQGCGHRVRRLANKQIGHILACLPLLLILILYISEPENIIYNNEKSIYEVTNNKNQPYRPSNFS